MRGASPENFSEFPLKSLLICCGVSKTFSQIFADSPELSAGGLQVSLEKCSREGRFTSLEIPLSFPPQGKVNAVSIVWFAVSNASVLKALSFAGVTALLGSRASRSGARQLHPVSGHSCC